MAEALRLAETFVRSASEPRVRSLYSGWRGRRQASSPRALGGRAHPLGPIVVVRDQSRVGRAERHDDAASERRDVHHPVGAEVAHAICERVGEDQTPLGVGVVHLNGLPVELGDDVSGLGGRAVGHVLRRRHAGHDAYWQAELGDRVQRLQDGGSAGHVHLHLLHLRRGLDGDPARVEGDSLAHEAERLARRIGRLVPQHDQTRLLRAALGDGREPAHPEGLDLGAAHDVGGDGIVARRDLASPIRQVRRRHDVGGQRLKLAGAIGGLGRDPRYVNGPRRLLSMAGGRDHQAIDLGGRRVVGVAGFEPVEPKRGQDHALDQGRREVCTRASV